jgi:hypothetical protein
MANSGSDSAGGFEKVVLHLESEVVKGLLEGRPEDTLDALLRNEAAGPPALLRIRLLSDNTIREIPIHSTKAIFFVKDFEGDPQSKNLRFHRGTPITRGVWIGVEFMDGEVMEGLVHNALQFLVEPGFFMSPSNPYSNNRLVYVVKSWLKEFRVLGLRNI